MSSTPVVLRGAQEPRICSHPPYASSTGVEAIELAAMAGLALDPWQRFVLTVGLGERPDGGWAAFEVGLVAPRQNGKDAVLEARQLAGLFILGERLIIHSAHQFDTSLEAFRRLLQLIEGSEELSRRVKRVARSHGEEGIELLNGQRVRFRTRTKGGGRGFSGDCLILNEAMILPEAAHGALLPTLAAHPNPQVWYAASAVDQVIHEHGRVLTRVRERGIVGDPGLAYSEWSVDGSLDDPPVDDRGAWAVANPGLGIRIGCEHVVMEQRSMDPRTFAVERLGIGDWPRLDGGEDALDLAAWNECVDGASTVVDPVVFCFDVSPDRAWASIGVAGRRHDGLSHIEIVDRRKGTSWLVDRIVELVGRHDAAGVACDGASPAAALLAQLSERGVSVDVLSVAEHAQACGVLFDAVENRSLRHLGTRELNAAVRGAARRNLGDAWAWSRKSSSTDISPLVAVTLALWKVAEMTRTSHYESKDLLVF